MHNTQIHTVVYKFVICPSIILMPLSKGSRESHKLKQRSQLKFFIPMGIASLRILRRHLLRVWSELTVTSLRKITLSVNGVWLDFTILAQGKEPSVCLGVWLELDLNGPDHWWCLVHSHSRTMVSPTPEEAVIFTLQSSTLVFCYESSRYCSKTDKQW